MGGEHLAVAQHRRGRECHYQADREDFQKRLGQPKQRVGILGVATRRASFSATLPVRAGLSGTGRSIIDVSLPASMELADELGIYAYDAYVLACAQEQRAPLLTLDRGLLRAGTKLDIEIMEFGG